MTEFDQLIQKWLDGSYTARDERAMRQLISRDPDAREALEGYLMHTGVEHTEQLQRLLDQMPKARSPQPFMFAYGKYLSAAAAVALLIAAWWLMRPAHSDNQQQVEVAAAENQIPQTAQEELPQPNPTHDATTAAPSKTLVTPTEPTATTTMPAPAPVDQAQEATANLALADQESKQTMTATESDYAVAPVKDEVAVVDKAPPAAPAAVKSRVARQSEESVKFDTDKRIITESAKHAQAEPEKGWDAFDIYLRQSLVYPKEAMEKGLKGSVRLVFSIDDAGNPEQIRVVRSLCLSCDVEAIRVLSEGPKWQPAGQKNVTVEIRFPR